jgi:hypothetical protein
MFATTAQTTILRAVRMFLIRDRDPVRPIDSDRFRSIPIDSTHPSDGCGSPTQPSCGSDRTSVVVVLDDDDGWVWSSSHSSKVID